ncbi:hypothetical protein [Deinococcus roseus]|uniref:Uncharacterized protein n=1 Tax=Deinococcus roseus TaxID=392414 RepID=A0ABQ2DAT7_9DEIO|nr:hypothetical protein [Deinococcus roseus]GGJ48042.1 hypothetical protein GCM10008938_37560 [Deinococcus roseus]
MNESMTVYERWQVFNLENYPNVFYTSLVLAGLFAILGHAFQVAVLLLLAGVFLLPTFSVLVRCCFSYFLPQERNRMGLTVAIMVAFMTISMQYKVVVNAAYLISHSPKYDFSTMSCLFFVVVCVGLCMVPQLSRHFEATAQAEEKASKQAPTPKSEHTITISPLKSK